MGQALRLNAKSFLTIGNFIRISPVESLEVERLSEILIKFLSVPSGPLW